MSQTATIKADVIEAGSGQTVMLVHSSASGARQWHRLMDDLKDQFHVQAVNLFGYGNTPAWPGEFAQTLDDQAQLVEAALRTSAESVCLVGHSLGGLVAMKVAARLTGRVAKLVLLEPIPFSILKHAGRSEAFAEVMALRHKSAMLLPEHSGQTTLSGMRSWMKRAWRTGTAYLVRP